LDIFLNDPELSSVKEIPPFTARPSTNGGLKLPPARPRPRNPSNPMDPPKSFMTKAEAEEMKKSIFDQLQEFDRYARRFTGGTVLNLAASPPFTIQRLCELCARPKQSYKTTGKYLRALEKTLLVTSTWDSFPVPPENENSSVTTASITLSGTTVSAPVTPVFSPIPFLHGDARSRSRSPPPLALNEVKQEPQAHALGLVDELDDPRPGHMSDRPTALSSTTTTVATLQERFVKATSTKEEGIELKRQKTGDGDAVMETDDKENQG